MTAFKLSESKRIEVQKKTEKNVANAIASYQDTKLNGKKKDKENFSIRKQNEELRHKIAGLENTISYLDNKMKN